MKQADAERMFRKMLLIRRSEEALIDLYQRNQIPGFIHPGIGEEAVHVGVVDHLDDRDHLVATHRGHGQALAKGLPARRMIAESLGRRDGALGGRGGSLHVGDWAIGVLPASPLVAGGLGTMTGVALAHQLDRDGGVAVCFFGDGAVNRGSTHEALNMASIWRLPIVYACIDNGWAISVQRTASTGGNMLDRARGYGMPGAVVPGKDLLACHEAAGEAITRAREGGGPSLLTFDCPRGYGHEEGDAQHYRGRDDYEAARLRDPIPFAAEQLTGAGLLAKEDLQRLEDEVAEEVRDAVEFALASPYPDPAEAFRHVLPSEVSA